MKRILNSQAGFSIVQVLIAAGLMGGLALMMAKLGQNQAKMQRKAIEDQDLNQFVNTVQKHLLNHEACKNTFENVVGLNSDGDDDDEHVDKILNFEKNTVFAVNTTSNYLDTDPSPNLKITSMRAIRGAGTELKLEIEIEKTNKGAQQSFGAKNFKKFIELDALYSNGEVLKCYSQLDSAVATACASLGGTIVGTDCINTTAECTLKREIVKLRKAVGSEVICGVTSTVAKVTETFSSASTASYTMPSSFIPGTLSVSILGAGGGGGCGCAAGGEGGGAGDVMYLSGNYTDSISPGESISYTVGTGGAGGQKTGCRFNNYHGQVGTSSQVTLSGSTYTVSGGRFGSAKQGSAENGVGVKFLGTWYPGGVYRANNTGLPGSSGAGGAGGEKTAVNCRAGGRGGDGIVQFVFKTYNET
jgi:hypothetical protein